MAPATLASEMPRGLEVKVYEYPADSALSDVSTFSGTGATGVGSWCWCAALAALTAALAMSNTESCTASSTFLATGYATG